MKPESNNKRPSRCLARLVRRLGCALAGHSTYATRADGKSNLRRSPVDDFVETECRRCGQTVRAVCGLALPNLKLGSLPNATGHSTGRQETFDNTPTT